MKTVKLPDHPGDLIRLAIKDLEKVEKSKDYVVHMLDWHLPLKNGKCLVCMAGAVMANTLKVDKKYYAEPGRFGEQEKGKLNAINQFRVGDIYLGLIHLNFDESTARSIHEEWYKAETFPPPYYTEDPKAFKACMLRMADFFDKRIPK